MSLPDFHPAYIALRYDGDLPIVSFTLERITEDENIEQLGHELFSLVDQYGCRKIVLDLTGVQYITSSVIGKLITLHRRLHRHSGRFVMCNLRKEVGDVFRTSGLLDYFHSADDLDAALAGLRDPSTS